MSHPNTPFDPSTPLRHLLRLAIPICRRGERDLPPRGPVALSRYPSGPSP